MTYAEWIVARRAVVWPDGEAANLVANHNKYIQDALIDLQNKIPCLQGFHRDNHSAESSYFDCGTSVYDAPVGFIKNVHTITETDCCARVWYAPVTEVEMRCKMENQQRCGIRYRAYGFYEYGDGYLPYPYEYECQIYPDDALDKPCRAADGSVALIEGQLYLHPHLQSTEIAVIEWYGLKKTWAPTDVMDFGTFERQVQNAVELYLERQTARKEDYDPQLTAGAQSDYDTAVAMLIHECEKLNRLTPLAYCFNNCPGC